MKVMILNILQQQADAMLSGVINKIGLTSMAGFIGIKASEEAGVIQLAETISESWSMADYGMLATTVGAVTFIIKNVMGAIKEGFQARKAYLETKASSEKLKDKE